MMQINVTKEHRQRLSEIRKSLDSIGSHEGQFIKIELLFFEAITIARDYGADADSNTLLYSLKKLQSDVYEKLNDFYKKRSQRETGIRRFIASFKKIISGKSLAPGFAG